MEIHVFFFAGHERNISGIFHSFTSMFTGGLVVIWSMPWSIIENGEHYLNIYLWFVVVIR